MGITDPRRGVIALSSRCRSTALTVLNALQVGAQRRDQVSACVAGHLPATRWLFHRANESNPGTSHGSNPSGRRQYKAMQCDLLHSIENKSLKVHAGISRGRAPTGRSSESGFTPSCSRRQHIRCQTAGSCASALPGRLCAAVDQRIARVHCAVRHQAYMIVVSRCRADERPSPRGFDRCGTLSHRKGRSRKVLP